TALHLKMARRSGFQWLNEHHGSINAVWAGLALLATVLLSVTACQQRQLQQNDLETNRAFVSIKPTLELKDPKTKQYKIAWEFHNWGVTRAKNILTKANLYTCTGPPTSDECMEELNKIFFNDINTIIYEGKTYPNGPKKS